jgi:predicted transcriptional regulator of viral defense system
MKWSDLISAVADEPVFETALLLAGDVDSTDVRRQLSRWDSAGKIVQLKRGLYALAPPFAKASPHPFLVANNLERGSYVSLQSALAFRGAIPEYVPTTTSVTTGSPGTRFTALGVYAFRHVASSLLWGAERLEVSPGQFALVATAEKALLDLVYLTPGADNPGFLRELRLASHVFDVGTLQSLALRTHKPKLLRAAHAATALFTENPEEWIAL